MKCFIIGLLSSILVVGNIQAQNAIEAFKRAESALKAYHKNPSSEKAQLQKAKTEIDMAVNDSQGNSQAKIWQLRGEVYNEIADQTLVSKQLGLGINDFPSVEDPAARAFSSFQKALELAEKNADINDALEGIKQTQSKLQNLAVISYEEQKYGLAYKNSINVLNAHELLKSYKNQSSLDLEQDYHDQLFVTGLSALNSERNEVADSLFQLLHKNNYENPMVYEALYKIHDNKTGNDQSAYQYLLMGREKFPDDASLLFAEINYLLKTNNPDRLTDRLEMAIQMEPDNVSLYATLGNVYDNLFQKEYAAGNKEKAQEYFDKALEYFNKAVEKKPDYFDAIYGIGALYYNKAAFNTVGLQALGEDWSAEGMKKYDDKKAEILDLFVKALPYFEKAETINPNDISTLIALKEIYARNDQLELSNEFKERTNKIQDGKRLKSYFKE